MARILIADDDELVADLASQVLIDAGHACGWVTTAEDTLALLVRKRPDLLLLDQDMPGMSGLTMLRQLRGSPEFYDLPVIMFTAMTGIDDESQAIYAGAQDYIRKPFDAAGLKGQVDRLLQKHAARPQHTDLKTHLANSAGLETAQPPASEARYRML